ncbi:MAG: hypothetical protein IJE90_05770 [Clostridia bacterium]|nr:hypothetical protein [Clostridia bacterium]
MTLYDEKLKALQEKIARSRQLSAMLKELRSQRDTIAVRVCELETVKLDEQADVERLEGRSLAAFFYNVVGKMDKQLDKERQEAYAAKVKYDTAVRELEEVESDLRRFEAEYNGLCGCEQQYKATLKEKAAAVKAEGGAYAEEILKLEERYGYLECQKKELCEAIFAGNSALSTAKSVLNSLDSAESWGTWDLWGGGLLADIEKHSHLDEAQGAIEQLQSQLRCFKTELADVTIHADMQVNVDGFLRFADWFFDGLFADWAVMDRISRSQSQVLSTKSQIESVLSRLNSMMNAAEKEQIQVKKDLDDIVLAARL